MKTIAQQLGITEFPFEIKDKNGNKIYFERSDGYWWKSEYDSNGNEIYYEDCNGLIIDDKPKPVIELTLDQIAEKMGIDVSQLRIKE